MNDVIEFKGIVIGSYWVHSNKATIYKVLAFANTGSHNEKYKPSIVYQGMHNNLIWVRPEDDWHRSMKETTFVKYCDSLGKYVS